MAILRKAIVGGIAGQFLRHPNKPLGNMSSIFNSFAPPSPPPQNYTRSAGRVNPTGVFQTERLPNLDFTPFQAVPVTTGDITFDHYMTETREMLADGLNKVQDTVGVTFQYLYRQIQIQNAVLNNDQRRLNQLLKRTNELQDTIDRAGRRSPANRPTSGSSSVTSTAPISSTEVKNETNILQGLGLIGLARMAGSLLPMMAELTPILAGMAAYYKTDKKDFMLLFNDPVKWAENKVKNYLGININPSTESAIKQFFKDATTYDSQGFNKLAKENAEATRKWLLEHGVNLDKIVDATKAGMLDFFNSPEWKRGWSSYQGFMKKLVSDPKGAIVDDIILHDYKVIEKIGGVVKDELMTDVINPLEKRIETALSKINSTFNRPTTDIHADRRKEEERRNAFKRRRFDRQEQSRQDTFQSRRDRFKNWRQNPLEMNQDLQDELDRANKDNEDYIRQQEERRKQLPAISRRNAARAGFPNPFKGLFSDRDLHEPETQQLPMELSIESVKSALFWGHDEVEIRGNTIYANSNILDLNFSILRMSAEAELAFRKILGGVNTGQTPAQQRQQRVGPLGMPTGGLTPFTGLGDYNQFTGRTPPTDNIATVRQNQISSGAFSEALGARPDLSGGATYGTIGKELLAPSPGLPSGTRYRPSPRIGGKVSSGGGGLPDDKIGIGTSGSEFLAARRARFAEEFRRDPDLKKRLAAVISLEHESDPVAVAESLMNRMDYSKRSIASGIGGGAKSFYGPVRKGLDRGRLAELERNPARMAKIMRGIDTALAGSNLIKGATDQGSPTDPNGMYMGGRIVRGGEVYNDWGSGPGRHEGARRYREELQAGYNREQSRKSILGAADSADNYSPEQSRALLQLLGDEEPPEPRHLPLDPSKAGEVEDRRNEPPKSLEQQAREAYIRAITPPTGLEKEWLDKIGRLYRRGSIRQGPPIGLRTLEGDAGLYDILRDSKGGVFKPNLGPTNNNPNRFPVLEPNDIRNDDYLNPGQGHTGATATTEFSSPMKPYGKPNPWLGLPIYGQRPRTFKSDSLSTITREGIDLPEAIMQERLNNMGDLRNNNSLMYHPYLNKYEDIDLTPPPKQEDQLFPPFKLDMTPIPPGPRFRPGIPIPIPVPKNDFESEGPSPGRDGYSSGKETSDRIPIGL